MHPLTRAEETNYGETSLHEHVMSFLWALEDRGDRRFLLSRFGRTTEGRELPLVIASKGDVMTPDDARRSGRPIVLVINGIHAGEVEGKEASMMLLRDWLDGKHPELLEELVVLFVPLFNPDGNDRIDPKNRALDIEHRTGQIGPAAGVGTRTNASGINLNRDYLRQEAREMQLLQARVCRTWQPHLTIDCHATNGSVHRFAMTYDTPHTVESGRPEPIAWMRERLLPVVRERLRQRTGLESFFYGNFADDEGQKGEGWMTYTHHPRFGSNFRGLTNRMDLLLETYSYLSFPERVRTTYEFLVETLRFVREKGDDMQETVARSSTPRERIAVRYRLDAEGEVEILTRTPRTLEGEPTSVRIRHLARFVGTDVVDRPWGYVVPPAVLPLLARHGIPVQTLDSPTPAAVEVAHIEGAAGETSRAILEATGEVDVRAHYESETRTLPAGTAIALTDHPLGAILTYLAEARSDDGLVACGVLPTPSEGETWPVLRMREPLSTP
jgi:hypothetical protein